METRISIYAFSPYVRINSVTSMLREGNPGIRPVLSGGVLMAPLPFFEKIPGLRTRAEEDRAVLSRGTHILSVPTGSAIARLDGTAIELERNTRMEKEYLCLPAAACLKALGIPVRTFDQLLVIAPETVLNGLEASPEERGELIRETCGIYNAGLFTPEDFQAGRDAWKRYLCGDRDSSDPRIPGMTALLEFRDRQSEERRRQMNRGPDAVILFGTLPPKESRELLVQYTAIREMALPYGTPGCRGFQDPGLLVDILYALDWMYDNMYGVNVLSDTGFRSWRIFNWWEWYVGGPLPLLDTLMILGNSLTPAQVRKYVLPVSFLRTQMRVEKNPVMGMSRITTLIPLALLTDDAALLQAEYLDECELLEEHDTGDCMRRDWCCMTHGMAYNIGYGTCNLDRVALVLRILEDSPLAFPIPQKYNLMHMIRYTFAPSLYRGRILNHMNGRIMQTTGSADQAASILFGMRNVLGLFGDEEDREILEIIHRNSTPEVRALMLMDPEGKTVPKYIHIGTCRAFISALTDPEYDTAPYTLGYMWYSGDSCVQFRNGYMIGLRMNSSRCPGYECINSANGDGWYTGEGTLYLYTREADREYDIPWWQGADKHLLGGTTVEDRQRESMFFDRAWKNSQDFVGGADILGQYVCAAMDMEAFHCETDDGRPDRGYGRSWPVYRCTLTGKKAYFMLDRVIAAIGTDITARDGCAVRTVVENRFFVDGITVNGIPISPDPAEFTREDIRFIHIPGTGGYIFPEGGKITVRVYEGAGLKYIAFWIEHGTDPAGAAYSYLILPDASLGETRNYDCRDIEILANSSSLQAVREKHSGLCGLIFREAGSFAEFTVPQPLILLTCRRPDRLFVTASDPTQKLDSFACRIAGVQPCGNSDRCVVLEETPEGAALSVRCDPSRGRGYRAEFSIGLPGGKRGLDRI